MSVNGSVSSSAGEVLVLSIRYVLQSPAVSVFLSQTEVYYIDQITFFTQSHEEIIRFDVPVNEVTPVYVFYTTNLELKKKG